MTLTGALREGLGETEMLTPSRPVLPGRGRGLRRALAPFRSARGLPRWLLWSGVALTLLFIVLAVFANLISPYGFNQYIAHGVRFAQQAPPSAAHWFGTTVAVRGRAREGHLRGTHVDRSGPARRLLLSGRRCTARARLGLLRWRPRPCPRAGERLDLRVPLPVARDRHRLPPAELGRRGRGHRRDRDHGRLHSAVLQGGPQHRALGARGTLRRGGPGPGCADRAR